MTNFINKYNTPGLARNYHYAEEFMENSALFIYSVGHAGDDPVITKTDQDGNVVWEYVYSLAALNSTGYAFRKIIRLFDVSIDDGTGGQGNGGGVVLPPGDDGGGGLHPVFPGEGDGMKYVLYVTDGEEHWLMEINSDGIVQWFQNAGGSGSDVAVYIEASKSSNDFYTVISNRTVSDGSLVPVIVRMAADASTVAATRIFTSPNPFVVNAIRTTQGTILLAGETFETDPKATVVELDESLGLVNANLVAFPYISRFQDVVVNPDNLIVLSGYLMDEQCIFACLYDAVNSTISPSLRYIPGTTGYNAGLAVSLGNVYLLQWFSENGIVYKTGTDFSIVWAKELQFGGVGTNVNNVNFLNYNYDSDRLTTNAVNNITESVLVYTDADMASCKTMALSLPSITVLVATIQPMSCTVAPALIAGSLIYAITNESLLSQVTPLCGGIGIPLDGHTSLQSPNFFLQAAGSNGNDGSAPGIHLRWLLTGKLGENHLPKGNYATTNYNFNRANDFVGVYRAPYVKVSTTLDLSQVPYLADDTNNVWLYRVGGMAFYVYFRNAAKYATVRLAYNPMSSPGAFVNAYGSEIIEIENKKELFFAVQLITFAQNGSSTLKAETLSVPENALAVSRTLSSRRTFAAAELSAVRLVCENGRSVRFKPFNCSVLQLSFEFYSTFIAAANNGGSWHKLDDYALTLDNSNAFSRLEPAPAVIDGKWPRFNGGDYVNVDNYKDKWNGTRAAWDRNIQGVVQNYIDLSNTSGNPRALETVPLNSGGSGVNDNMELSNLDLLNMAGYDFHIARMLGLGTLDLDSAVSSGQFVYVAMYTTEADLGDGDGARLVNHLSMSIPCSVNDQRLPLPVDIRTVVPGAFFGNESPEPSALTDAEGYTQDGRARYVTVFAEPLPTDEVNRPFYFTTREFNGSAATFPVYAGIEYKKNSETDWQKPELPNDPRYNNRIAPGQIGLYESIPLGIPEGSSPLYVHKQKVSGKHYYGSYGINWFSRAAASALDTGIETSFKPSFLLKPPANINALLVRQESPLLLTSAEEQARFAAIGPGQDRTLIRLTFDYNSNHELLDYVVPLGADINDPNVIPADNSEVFADKVSLLFKNTVPASVSGKLLSISDHPTNPILSVILTGGYVQSSTGDVLQPILPSGSVVNYSGGLLISGAQQYVIHDVVLPTGSMLGPQFTVYKKELSDGIVTDEIPSAGATQLQSPQLVPDGLFMAVENMQSGASWGTPNPLGLKPQIGVGWSVHRELVTITNSDGSSEQHLEKTRGIWDSANVETVNEPVDLPGGGIGSAHRGLYRITFQNEVLAQHGQYNGAAASVEWYQGVVRIHTTADPNGERKLLRVARMENVGASNKLVLYATDASFSTDTGYPHILTGIVSVNFYPGYKVYLYTDSGALTYPNILPAEGEGVHYSIFGLRSYNTANDAYSRVSAPQLMFAQEQTEALVPLLPTGPLYATRPDFFGRSTYTVTSKYNHKPYALLFYRSNNEALLNALYSDGTVAQIKTALKALGGNYEPDLAARWHNFFDFTALASNGDYMAWPAAGGSITPYKFPHPDKQAFFDWANEVLTALGQPAIAALPGTLAAGDSSILSFVKGAVFNAFVSLAEVPLIFQYISGSTYQPTGKKQTIRDKDGNLLAPGDNGFDIAPMMKITGGSGNETLFTDFTLDGTLDNLYFYALKELSSQMKMSDFSPVLGPVKLINSNPPEAPQVKRVMPVLENTVIGRSAALQIEMNAYPEVQNVKRVSVYRALSAIDGQSVRTMKLVKEVDLETENIIADQVWVVTDSFDDMAETPYSDGLFYRLVASRKVEYADRSNTIVTDYAPSLPSKLMATMIVEANNPEAPVLTYTSTAGIPAGELDSVTLHWDKTAYKAKYHVYKMNSSGNWVKIHELTTNDAHIDLALLSTDLGSGTLQTLDGGNNIYHHFKVVAENTSGMLSTVENILTIPA